MLTFQNDYEDHKISLKEASTRNKNEDDIVYLMKETYHNRRQELKAYPCRPMFDLCNNFPVMKQSKYVSMGYTHAWLQNCLFTCSVYSLELYINVYFILKCRFYKNSSCFNKNHHKI